MTSTDFADWLEKYVRPQERGDAGMIKELFAEDAVYWYGPFTPPRHGVEAICEHHQNALTRQTGNKFEIKILTTTEAFGIAHFRLTLTRLNTGEHMEYVGVFQVFLNESNECTSFQEWYHTRTVE